MPFLISEKHATTDSLCNPLLSGLSAARLPLFIPFGPGAQEMLAEFARTDATPSAIVAAIITVVLQHERLDARPPRRPIDKLPRREYARKIDFRLIIQEWVAAPSKEARGKAFHNVTGTRQTEEEGPIN